MLFNFKNMEKLRGAIAVFIGAACFGILSTFVKKSYASGFTLAEVTGVQALLGMICLWMLYLILKLSNYNFSSFTKKTASWKIIVAGISTGLVSILYYKCVELVPASIAIVLLMQFIWIGALINYVVYRQAPSKKQFIGILLILISTVFATGAIESTIDNISSIGVMYGILAATAYAIFLIVNGKIGNDYPPVHKSALMVTGAFIFIFCTLQPVSLFNSNIDFKIYQYGTLLAIFGTVLPPFLFAYGMPKIGVSLGSILSAVELPVAVCMSYFVLSETVSIIQWIGVIAILSIVVWINYNKRSNI